MNKQKLRKIANRVLLMLVGGGTGFLAAKIGMEAAGATSTAQLITYIIGFLPAFLLVVAVHEAGHALAGMWVSFDFRMYVVGPFLWDKEQSGWKFKWNKNVNVAGGLVICIPQTTENLSKRFSIYSLGGPTASLLLTALTFAVNLALHRLNSNASLPLEVAASFFGLTGFLSLMIFIATIIPMHTSGFYTDGARALRFLRGGDTAQFETLLIKTISTSYSGIRPRLLNKAEIMEALSLANMIKAKMKVFVLYYLYQIALDEGELDEAEVHLKEYVANVDDIPKGLRGSVYLDAAFFYAYARKDLVQAEFYWQQYVPSAIIAKAQVLATEAALLNLKNNTVEMYAAIDKAFKEVPNMMDRGAGVVLLETLNELKQQSGNGNSINVEPSKSELLT